MGDVSQEIKDFPPGPLDTYRKRATFDWKVMKSFLEDPEITRIKMKLWKQLEDDPIFQRPVAQPTTDEMKKRTALQLKRYLTYPIQSVETSKLPYRAKTRLLMTINEALNATFPDVSVKLGIGVLVFKNVVTTLGTERHARILRAAWDGKVVASLAMTEIAHGSNTKQVRTTATYDPSTEEFVIHTPDFQAAKCWVGNLGKTCTLSILFAQLHTNGQCHGLHAFLVPIRDPRTLLPYPGVTVGDMGEKIGLHGIDNGFVLFDRFRIPRENLLNRTGDVTPAGEYESSFSEPGRILGAALENLSTGRVGIMQECMNNLIMAVTIAVRYAAVRKQFAGNSDEANESPIIEYQLHQWRLFPHVAAAVVLKVFVSSFTEEYLEAVEKATSVTKIEDLTSVVAEIHAIVSSSKPIVSWTARDAVQESREACGGHGFLKAARIGDLRAAVDACVTYEGDNNVLGQQASNWLLRQWGNVMRNEPPDSPLGTVAFLSRHREILGGKMQGGVHDLNAILSCYEWLVTYLSKETYEKRERLTAGGACRTEARNASQVFLAAVLTRAFAELTALRHFARRAHSADARLRPVLADLGLLFGLHGVDRHAAHFYEGGHAPPGFGAAVKAAILELCAKLKDEMLAVVDALAPPDFVLNSVLGKSDGKLYENLQNCLFHAPGALTRPDWWQEVIIPGAPEVKCPRSKL